MRNINTYFFYFQHSLIHTNVHLYVGNRSTAGAMRKTARRKIESNFIFFSFGFFKNCGFYSIASGSKWETKDYSLAKHNNLALALVFAIEYSRPVRTSPFIIEYYLSLANGERFLINAERRMNESGGCTRAATGKSTATIVNGKCGQIHCGRYKIKT